MLSRTVSIVSVGFGVFRRPGFWLAVQLVLVTVVAVQTGELRPKRVPDTSSYIGSANAKTVETALSRYRTYGYPLFLRFFKSEGRIQLDWVPTVHLLAFLSSIAVFAWASGRFLGSKWLALAAASPLAYAPAMDLLPRIQPDFLAAAFVILAVSSLMLLVHRRAVGLWVTLTLAVFVSYQLRPASALLVGFIPLCGLLFVTVRDGARPKQALRFAGTLAALTFVPFLAFSGLRWVVTGHFGLVSFAGINLAGITVCFLDGPLVEQLPPEQERLARQILKLRHHYGFKPLRRGKDPEAWFSQISPNIFGISFKTVKIHMKQEAAAGDSARLDDPLPPNYAVEADRRLSALAKEILRRRGVVYLDWIRGALRFGVRQLIDWPVITFPFLLLMITSPLVALNLAVRPRQQADAKAARRMRSLTCLALAAVAFFLMYLTLTSALSFPFSRYFVSTVLFIPSALTALLFESWRLLANRDSAH